MLPLKRRLICLFAVAIVSTQFAACKGNQPRDNKGVTPATEQKVPVISAVQPEFDFGQVKQGQEVSHIYKIKNVGSKELVIEKTRGS